MKRVLFVYRTQRSEILDGVVKGKEPNHLLYGFNYLKQENLRVEFSDIAYKGLMFFHWLVFPIEQLMIKLTSVGFKIDQAILIIPNIKKSDVVVTTADSAGLPVLFLKYLKFFDKPIIYISTGLINELYQRKNLWLAKFYFKLFVKADFIVCHSLVEKDLFIQLNPKLSKKVIFLPFGIDVNYFKEEKRDEEFIFSVGQDKSRDYSILKNVARRFPEENFVIIAQPNNVEEGGYPTNVKILFDQPYFKVKNFYCYSKIVFLPLKELNRAAGQIAFLEALASNNKVVVSEVKGLKDCYPDLFEGNKNVFLFKAGSTDAAEDALKKALKKEYKKVKMNVKYTSQKYAKGLAKLINRI